MIKIYENEKKIELNKQFDLIKSVMTEIRNSTELHRQLNIKINNEIIKTAELTELSINLINEIIKNINS